jgi:hypothetical protein
MLRIYLKFSYLTSSRFSDTFRISIWREHHDKISNPKLPPEVGNSDPHSSLNCCAKALSAVPPPQYIVIAANFFHPPTTCDLSVIFSHPTKHHKHAQTQTYSTTNICSNNFCAALGLPLLLAFDSALRL